jgi:hypothetical protein
MGDEKKPTANVLWLESTRQRIEACLNSGICDEQFIQYRLSTFCDIKDEIKDKLGASGQSAFFPELAEAEASVLKRAARIEGISVEDCKAAVVKALEERECAVKYAKDSLACIRQAQDERLAREMDILYPNTQKHISVCKEIGKRLKRAIEEIPDFVVAESFTNKEEADKFKKLYEKKIAIPAYFEDPQTYFYGEAASATKRKIAYHVDSEEDFLDSNVSSLKDFIAEAIRDARHAQKRPGL